MMYFISNFVHIKIEYSNCINCIDIFMHKHSNIVFRLFNCIATHGIHLPIELHSTADLHYMTMNAAIYITMEGQTRERSVYTLGLDLHLM